MRSTDNALKVKVNLVLVRVVVRDTKGNAVPDLKQQDFQVWDNGTRQKISSFNVETAEMQGNNAKVEEGKIAGTATETNTSGAVSASAMPQRFLALVFDDLHMRAADAMAVHAAAEKLFASLTPTDRVAIYSTEGSVQQDFTADSETLRKTLTAITPHPAKGEGQHDCPNITYYQADLIVNKHDRDAAIVAALDAGANQCPVDVIADAQRVLQEGDSVTGDNYQRMEDIVNHLASMPGRRVLVYVSPGFLLTDAVMRKDGEWIARAVGAGVVVNTIDARGLYTADMLPDIEAPPQQPPSPPPTDSAVADYQLEEAKYRMQAQFQSGLVLGEMAASTGGRFFHNRNDLDAAMRQALAAPEVSYMLGFSPEKQKLDGKFHHLKVKVENGKKYQIEARSGYYASKIPLDREDAARQEVRGALFSPEQTVTLPMQLRTEFSWEDTKSEQLSVLTHLDTAAMRFRKVDGRSCNDLTLAVGLFDTNGRLVDGQMREIALKLKDTTLDRMRGSGLTLKNVFTVKPGTYMVRSVIRESEGDALTARNVMTVIPREGSNERKKNVSFQDLRWSPPRADARLKSLTTSPACDLSEVLKRTGENSLALATNLEKFTAQEHIDYAMLDRAGMVEDYDSGGFQYVYSIEQQNGGSISKEYRTPLKGSHVFRASEQGIGEAAIALMFLPDLQADYEMKCQGAEERNGQLDWVLDFEQRKDRPSRTAKFWVDRVAYPGAFKGHAWISEENFQVVHLEANLMDGVPDIGLQEMAFTVDYGMVPTPSGNLGLWLPNKVATYWDFDAHRIIVDHKFADFQVFAIQTTEQVQPPKAH